MPAASDSSAAPLDGVLVVDKPAGMTSHDVVAWARRLLGMRRIGHVGTLDPLATGVLPLVVGRATRLAALLAGGPKTYRAVIRLGLETDTYDATGTPQSGPPDAGDRARSLDQDAAAAACRRFTGVFRQRPPAYSAKKVGGVPAHRLARRQQHVDLRPVEVVVHRFDVLALRDGHLDCRVCCSPGFYMRSLAHDLGRELGCGGCLEQLRRERSGPFALDSAVDLHDESARGAATAWWEQLTEAGGEGMVVKPWDFAAVHRGRLVQPALKCRGREYLRIIYGPEYTAEEHLQRLRERGVGTKRSLAVREFALGIEGLERFVARQPLRSVHECAFAVLALESEPVDPRL